MSFKRTHNRLVDIAFGRKRAELETNEFDDVELSIRQSLHPISKCNDVLFIYRLSDLERCKLKVGADNPGYIAVIK